MPGLLIALAAAVGPALAWDSTGAVWPPEAFPVPVYLSEYLPGDLDEDEVVAALEAALATWTDVDCVPLELTYAGRTGGSFGGEADGKNVVYILDQGWTDDAGLLSTPVIRTSGKDLVEVDLALNAQYFSWATDGAGGSGVYDVQGAFTHELGNLIGLWHSTVAGATLNPAMDGNVEARTLEDDDLAGICAIYEGLALGGSAGEFGDSCTNNDDCADGLLCAADGDVRYCTQSCETDAECLNGYACYEAGDGSGICATVTEEGGCGGCASGGGEAAAGAAGSLSLLGLLGLGLLRRRRS